MTFGKSFPEEYKKMDEQWEKFLTQAFGSGYTILFLIESISLSSMAKRISLSEETFGANHHDRQ